MLFNGLSNTIRFLVLISIIFLYITTPPFIDLFSDSNTFFNIFFDILTTAILVSTVFALNKNKRYVIISALLVAPLILSIWQVRVTGNAVLGPTGLFFGILFFLFTAFHILKVIFSRKYVTLEVIVGAIAVYLMLGIIWSICYGFLETIYPGSFSFATHGESFDPYSIIYFSFVTLTTLGYGDTVPITSMAQSLTIVEALVGQIYLVVVVAWLVGMFISAKGVKKRK